jgi:hypothetical protein
VALQLFMLAVEAAVVIRLVLAAMAVRVVDQEVQVYRVVVRLALMVAMLEVQQLAAQVALILAAAVVVAFPTAHMLVAMEAQAS